MENTDGRQQRRKDGHVAVVMVLLSWSLDFNSTSLYYVLLYVHMYYVLLCVCM